MLAGCAASKAEIRTAEKAAYDADFAVVYSETLAAVEELYANLVENASTGVIKTAWHPLRINVSGDSPGGNQAVATTRGQTSPLTSATGARNYYFVRFTVRVIGGDPWRVVIDGQASKWDVSGVPVELKGGDEPTWLAGRTNALRVAIHKRLEAYAVEQESAPAEPEESEEPLDLGPFDNLPPAAAEVVAEVLAACKRRDFEALGATMAEQFTWSLGAPPDARAAMSMWQADSSVLAQLVAVIEAGCRASEDQAQVTCPPAYSEKPGYTGYRVGFARTRADIWQMTFFLAGD